MRPPGREAVTIPAAHCRLIVHRNRNDAGKMPPDHFIGLNRTVMLVGHEQRNRADALPPRLLGKADIAHQREEWIEQFGG